MKNSWAGYLVIGLMFVLFFTGIAYVEGTNINVVATPGVPHDISGITDNMTLVWNSTLGIFEPGNVSGGGGGVETDPVFTNHTAYTIQSAWMANWNTSFGWGDHSVQNYFDKDIDNLTAIQDVNTTGIADGKILKFNATSADWEIADDNSGGGGTPTTEAELEANLTDVADVYTDNDFADNSADWDTSFGWGPNLWDRSGTTLYTNTDGDAVQLNNTLYIVHTATESDDHTLELVVDAAGYGDVKALDINYITGAIAMGQDEGVILLNIDETLATGGSIFGLEILATDGGSDVYGMKTGVLIGPIHQDSGIFVNPTTGTNNTPSTDVPAMIDGAIGTTTAIFGADNDYIIVGSATAFEEMEFILTTSSSNPGIKPTFWYSTAGSGQFTQFTPVDGTNGFRNTGVVAWDQSDLTGHTTNDDTGTYDIKVIRTQNVLLTEPILGYVKVASTTEYVWNKDGDLSVNNINAVNCNASAFFGDGGNLTNITAAGDGYAGSLGHPHNQGTNTTEAVVHTTVDTGQGANELYDMDQNVLQVSAVTFATVDTGYGANELWDMNQHVLTSSDVIFDEITGDNLEVQDISINEGSGDADLKIYPTSGNDANVYWYGNSDVDYWRYYLTENQPDNFILEYYDGSYLGGTRFEFLRSRLGAVFPTFQAFWGFGGAAATYGIQQGTAPSNHDKGYANQWIDASDPLIKSFIDLPVEKLFRLYDLINIQAYRIYNHYWDENGSLVIQDLDSKLDVGINAEELKEQLIDEFGDNVVNSLVYDRDMDNQTLMGINYRAIELLIIEALRIKTDQNEKDNAENKEHTKHIEDFLELYTPFIPLEWD